MTSNTPRIVIMVTLERIFKDMDAYGNIELALRLHNKGNELI